MAQVEEDIIAAGARIIWVLEQTRTGEAGTAQTCREAFDGYGSDKGLCVGDGQTMPNPGTFDDSPFAMGRAIDLIVRRSDMRLVFEAAHGTPRGNENLTGEEVLAEIRAVTGR